MAAGYVAIQHNEGCDTATAASTIRTGRRATQRGTPVTQPATSCDMAGVAPRHGAVRSRPGRSVCSLGLLGVHLCTQLSFVLSALFQSLFGSLFMNIVHKIFQNFFFLK